MSDGFPLQMGSREAFARVRSFLEGAGFTEEWLKGYFGVPHLHNLLYAYGLQAEYLRERYQGEGLLVFLARTFLAGYDDAADRFAAQIETATLTALRELGLLAGVNGRWSCPVLLYPALGFFVTADRGVRPDGGGYREKDYVMSGTEHLCRQFVSGIARTPCRRFLDMGTGSGLAALQASRSAGEVWAVDITPRAVRFAEFNCRLNGRDNIRVLQGDLFSPVGGLQFDRIAANPPFEPPLKEGMIFSVGGEDGEAILARFVTEVPGYIEPGGRIYCLVSGTDRKGDPFDARLRRWLGDAGPAFDSALFVRTALPPKEYAIEQILGENQDAWQLQKWLLFYEKLQAEQVILGHLVLQRRASERPVFHVRRSFGPASSVVEMDWLLDWETRAVEPGIEDVVFGSALANVPGWELHVTHERAGGRMTPRSCAFVQTHPFEVRLEAPSWQAMLAAHCDGVLSGAAQYEWLRGNAPVSRTEFTGAVCRMVGAGVLALGKTA